MYLLVLSQIPYTGPSTQEVVRKIGELKTSTKYDGIVVLQMEVAGLNKVALSSIPKELAKSLLDQSMIELQT